MTKTQSCPLSPKSSRAHRLKCPTAVLQNHGGLWYIPTGSRAQQQGADLTFTSIIPQSKTLGLTVSIADSNCKCYILKEGEDYTDSLAISSLLLLTGLGTRRASFKYSSKVLFAVQRPLSTLCWNQQVNQPWLTEIQHKAKAKAVRISPECNQTSWNTVSRCWAMGKWVMLGKSRCKLRIKAVCHPAWCLSGSLQNSPTSLSCAITSETTPLSQKTGSGTWFSEANKPLRLQRQKEKELKQCQACHPRKDVDGKATRLPSRAACQPLELNEPYWSQWPDCRQQHMK